MATLDTSPGPTSPSLSSSRSLAQPRHRNKPTYVQRFKVLRDRNKNLPKLDFSDKASGIPKKLQGVGSFSRSYTYDSMKLPSISTSSVVTGVSGKSVHSDGYRRKDPREKRSSLHDGQSEPYNSDFATQRELIDLSTLMSKTLENKEPGHKQNAPKPPEEKIVNDKGHRYESITYKKHLLKRHKVSDKVRSNREKSIIAQAEKHLKQTVEKELMQPKEVKDDKRDLNETQDSGFTGSGEKRKGKTPDILSKPCSPTDDVTTHQELGTPDTDIPLSPVTTATKSSIPHNDNNKT